MGDTTRTPAEHSELLELRQAARRSAFLLEASSVLSASPEYESTLGRVARLAVPCVADCCVVEIAADDGTTTPVEIAHADADKRELVSELWRRYPPNPGVEGGITQVLRSGQSVLRPRIDAAQLRAAASDDEQFALLSALDIASMIIVPLIAGGRPLGAITLVASGARVYGPLDLAMAEDLAQRAASAIESGRLLLETRQAVSAREDLLGIVAHDLRNPLSGMLMRCSLLLETLPKDEAGAAIRRDVEAMRRSAHRIEALLRDLLDFAKIRAGGLAIERQPLRAGELLREALESVPPLAAKRTIEVDLRLGDESIELRCDRERFLQIFANLISNAIKFTKADGCISISAQVDSGALQVSIRDNGPGVTADEMPHVFQKYWQKRPRSGGVGLGLFIAKTLVEAQGGRIRLESEPGSGTTVTFTVPIAGATSTVGQAQAVLVVDDDSAFRRELVEVLAAEGYSVADAADGKQALHYLAAHAAPSLILVDLMMPAMDGWEFSARVRAQPELRAIPLVAMSRMDREEASGSLHGFTGYLRKPPRLEQLLALLQRDRE